MNKDEQLDFETDEVKRLANDYTSYMHTYVDGFVSDIFSHGLINEVDKETLKNYFTNPDRFQKEIEDIIQYYYISSAEMHQLYELIEALPTLNYKVDYFTQNKNGDKFISMVHKCLHRIKHKRLTRDTLKQVSSAGTFICIWLGDRNNLYPYVFDRMDYVFPAYRGTNGEWVVAIDMQYFNSFTESYRNILLRNLAPYVTKAMYDSYLADGEKNRYVYLPQERTCVIQTGTLKRNQNLGIPWGTAGLYDVVHKKKMKDVENAIANKIINAVAVLTIGHAGTDKNNDYTNAKLPPNVKKKIYGGVKSALEKNQSNGITVVAIPDYSKIEFPDVSSDGLDSDKFNTTNTDIQTALGLSGAVLNGGGSSISTAKLNLDVFYRKIGVLLEDIETEMYQKMINLLLPTTQKDNFFIKYDKEAPLTLKEKIDLLGKLHDKGWSIKHLVDSIDGVTWDSFLEQTLYETEELKLQERIKPYLTSYTMTSEEVAAESNSSSGETGRPTMDVADVENENTQKTKNNQ